MGLFFHWCRTPQGVRGLKFTISMLCVYLFASHPARGAWIEMLNAAVVRGGGIRVLEYSYGIVKTAAPSREEICRILRGVLVK